MTVLANSATRYYRSNTHAFRHEACPYRSTPILGNAGADDNESYAASETYS